MARREQKKEAIILAIDIGKNSVQLDSNGKTYFEQAVFCASMIIQRKLLSESKDDLALILFGSSQTNNQFSSNGQCYKNIEIVTSLGAITWDLAQYVTSISSTDIFHSDWLSTLVIATDILKNETDSGLVFTDCQIVMFSNFASDISPDKIDTIIRIIKDQRIKLNLIGKDLEEIVSYNPILEKLVSKTKANAVNFESVIPNLHHYKTKEVTPRAWNVSLSFGNVFCIKVCGYKKIDEVPKGFKWLLCKNNDTSDSITAVRKETSYYYVENGKKIEVDRDDLLDGFRFGDTIIPISDFEKNAYDYKSGPKSLLVLGFEKAKNIQRSWFMDGGSYIYKPDEKSFIAFEALFNAMVEREEVMIVRKVYQLNSMPNIGAMFPQSEDNENFFVFVNLPYSQDQRIFKLPSLKLHKPNDKQKNAVHDLIKAMNLDDDEEDELFMPESTFNPELQYMYYCIAQKAVNKDKLLSKTIPEYIQSSLKPPKKIIEKAEKCFNEIKELFPLVPKIDDKNEVNGNILNPSIISKLENNEEEIEKPCIITAYSPIEDFNKHLEDGIDSETVCLAMKNLTVNLIESSCSFEELKKPASNLMALRQFYIHNNDFKSYNDWMYLVKDSILLFGKEKMWSQFIDSGIGLITNQEIESSDVSQESSEEFRKYELPEDVEAEFIIDDDDPLKMFL